MQQTGYIFTRNGTPDPSKNEYFYRDGVMHEPDKHWLAVQPSDVSIYMKWADYLSSAGAPN